MKRFLARVAGMTLLLGTVAMGPAVAANELALSADGLNWTQSITTPLLDESTQWVPGDTETFTFYARNQGGSDGDLSVDLLGSTWGDLIDSGDLHVTATGGDGTWTTVSEAGTHRLLTTPNIADGNVVPIDVTVTFDLASPNATQTRASELNFRATLSEHIPADPDDPAIDADHGGAGGADAGRVDNAVIGLPSTGAKNMTWFLAIGAILVGTGLGLVSRRRGEETPHV